MWLYLVEACDIYWHYELSKSLLTPPCGWWLRSSHSSVSGAAADQPVELENKDDCKTHPYHFQLLDGWEKTVLLHVLCSL